MATTEKSESPKKTLFLSLADATDEEIDGLIEAFKKAGLTDQYHGVITAQPIQMMDPGELIEQLRYIYNVSEDGDPNNVGITRTDRFRQQLRYNAEFMEIVFAMMRSMQDNIDHLTNLFNHHVHADGGHNTAHHAVTHPALGIEQLESVLTRMRTIKPKEGEMI